ncbi:RHS repeat-associated core domain-containing protein [Paraburkholderia fungorum]|uniref:RHS repeat-associated core domain-containing protein n=1 Tax=Paraburkholderia fungorum TaxID=134537 RepID=A0A1H1JZV6_9BURK|nr:RHS repeat-associated core domain-containing protein [Paraburkholderia fungorum]SDR55155.1 RHS repeat-associated core domain-containing protein [Paraburkholderia fungorum]
MVAAIRTFFRVIIVIFILILSKPALAAWGTTTSSGCGQNCASPQDVCDFWGAAVLGYCLGIGPPIYSATGKMIGTHYSVSFVQEYPVIDGEAFLFCTAPYTYDGLAPSGCSLAVTVPEKQLGCGCSGEGMVGNPITLNIGNKFEVTTDFETDGQNSLAFVRYYNSQSQQKSSLGFNWRSNFDRGFRYNGGDASTSTIVWFTRPDGATYSFTNVSGAWLPSDVDVNMQLTSLGASGWVLADQNDNVETYTLNGQLTSIKTRSGYEQDLTYDADGNLVSVTDSFGRTLAFSVVNGVIHTMTDPDGKLYTYGYANLLSTSDQLVNVNFPGSNSPTIQYLYENASYPYALTGIVDEKGTRYATWSYDSTMRAVSSEHAGGVEATSLAYNLNSNGAGTVTTTNALGKEMIYTLGLVAGAGKITGISGPASANTAATSESFTYDSNGYIASHTDNNGNLTKYVNDTHGHVTSETDASGTEQARTITTAWDAIYNLPTETVQPGLTTDYTYSSGLLTTKSETDTTTTTAPYSTNGTLRTWTYTYFPTGLLHTVDGPLTGTVDTVAYTYTPQGCVASFTNEVGQVTSITSVNGRCEPLSSVDPNGVVSNYTYDDRGRITSVTINPGADQSETGFTYDLAGNLTDVTFPDSSTLTYAYDDAHRLTAITNNLGESITYSLDAMGNRTATAIKSASMVITKQQSATFDELGRLMADIGAASQTTTYKYDLNSNETATTDPRGKVYGHTFDVLNRLYQEVDPDSGYTTTAFNGKDEVIGVTDARSLGTTYVRDGFGNTIQRTSPDTGIDKFWYDLSGNIIRKVDARGVETDFAYDAASRLISQTFPTASSENVTFGYDATANGNKGVGHLTSFTDPSGSTASVYDALGRVVSDARLVAGVSHVMTYTYDRADNILTETYPSGRIVAYARDATGRITAVTTQQNSGAAQVSIVAGASYQPFGPLAGLTFGNGLAASITSDLDYQPTGFKVTNGTTTIQNITNGFDASGNITSITDHLATSRSQNLVYDDLNRLATASGTYGTQTYTYDGVSNRLSRSANGTTEAYAYPSSSNRLASVTTSGGSARNFSYEASGQMSQDVRDSGQTYVFTVNGDGRDAAVSLNGEVAGSYLYNALGQRVQKIAGGITTQLIFDRAGRLMEETDGYGAVLRDYVWLDRVPVALVDDTGSSPVIYYIHTDQLGTPQKMTDGSANIVWDNVTDPFGNSVATQGTSWSAANWGSFNWAGTMLSLSNLRFPGQYFDRESGLNQNWNRDYDPTTGRYVQSDPVGLIGGVNTYQYLANPVTWIDPFGLEKTYQTYTKLNPVTGEVYTGRTSGDGDPLANIARRDRYHHMGDRGFGPAVLDVSSTDACAIRGREQLLIDAHGGARSMGGTSGNAINGISPYNPKLSTFLGAAEAEFGPIGGSGGGGANLPHGIIPDPKTEIPYE